jgi:hypothetical protein
MLARLETKGYLRHHEEGVRYVYSATTSQATARRAALQQYVRVFFGGSQGQMVTSLLRQESWTEEELEALDAEIKRARGQRRLARFDVWCLAGPPRRAVVKPFLGQHPISYPIILGSDGPAQQYKVTNLPVTLLNDRSGRIADSHLGVVDKVTWENEIRQLLQEKAK